MRDRANIKESGNVILETSKTALHNPSFAGLRNISFAVFLDAALMIARLKTVSFLIYYKARTSAKFGNPR